MATLGNVPWLTLEGIGGGAKEAAEANKAAELATATIPEAILSPASLARPNPAPAPPSAVVAALVAQAAVKPALQSIAVTAALDMSAIPVTTKMASGDDTAKAAMLAVMATNLSTVDNVLRHRMHISPLGSVARVGRLLA